MSIFNNRKHNFHPIAFFLIITCFMFFNACLNDSPKRIPPKAVQGVIDLTDWDFNKDGPVNLSGQWEFYWQQHLLPKYFITDTSILKTNYIEVPGYWEGYRLEEKKLPGYGYATYRLNILLTKQEKSLALKTVEISTAYKMFINGQMVNSLGQAGKDRKSTVPKQIPQIIDFAPHDIQTELIFQVSNFHHRRGGIWEIIQIGKEEDIRNSWERGIGFNLFLIGSILLMAFYNIGLFIFIKRDRSPLYFSAFCFLIALRAVTTGDRYLNYFFPGISWEVMIKLEYLSYYLAVPAFAMFMQSIFPKFYERILFLLKGLAIIFACAVVLTPARIFSYTLNIYEIITLIMIIYALYVIFASIKQKRIEAYGILFGFAILSLTIINDMLHVEGIIQTGFYLPYGFFLFILIHSIIVSYRFSSAIATVEQQQIELKDTLESLKTEVIERVQAEKALCESEDKYRTILHSIEEGYYEVDLAGNLTFVNDSLVRNLGYSKDELIGMNNRQFTSEEYVDEVYKTFNSVYSTGKAATALDWEMIAKDGSKKFIEISVSLIKDPNGQPIGFRGVARNITERKKAEEQTRLHQQQLMQASKMVALGTLVSGVAHEINNPNNFIMLNSPILEEAWKNAMPIMEKYYEENGDFILGGMKFSEMRTNIPVLFAGISDGSKRIKRIVDDLKNYVRNETADLNQPVDINAIIKSAVSLLSNMIKKATHKFSIVYDENIPLLNGNFQRLEQVMINLIQNACQALANPDKGLFISTANHASSSCIVITIRDEGVGITSETLMHIMDPFFTTKHENGGIGLGLSISSRIVEEHGGTINFASDHGVGTTATIMLPIDFKKQSLKGICK